MEGEPDTIFIQNRDSSSMSRFKEDIVNALYEIEDKINNKGAAIENILNSKLSIFEHRLNDFDIKIQDVITKQSQANKRLDPLNDALPTILKHDEAVISHEIRLNSLSKEISNACYKYDKMFMDNLYLPGLIGDYCKFKNVREFLDYTQTQLSSLNTFKDKTNTDMKGYKERIEQSLKIASNDLEAISRNCSGSIKRQTEMLNATINERFNEYSDMANEIKLENKEYVLGLAKDTNALKEEMGLVKKLREEIEERNERIVKEVMEINVNTLNNFGMLKNEFNKINRHFNEIAEFIKDVRFKRNINEQISKNELKKLANELVENKSNTIPTMTNTANSGGTGMPFNLSVSNRKEKKRNNKSGSAASSFMENMNTNTVNLQLQSQSQSQSQGNIKDGQGIPNIIGVRNKTKKRTIKELFNNEIEKKKLNCTTENEVVFIDALGKENKPMARSRGNSPLSSPKKHRQSAKLRLRPTIKKGKTTFLNRNHTTSPDHKLKFNEINAIIIHPEEKGKFATFIPKLKPKEHMIYKMVKNEYGHMVKTNSSSFFKPNKTVKKL